MNDDLIKAEINEQIEDFLEFSENANTMYPNLWDKMKVVLREQFILLSDLKWERSHTNNLTAYLKAQEQKEVHALKKIDGR